MARTWQVPERSVLVGIVPSRTAEIRAERSLDELGRLVAAAGGAVGCRVLQIRRSPDPTTYLGRGKLGQVARLCDDQALDLVVFDHDLSPAQLREIEARVGRRVIDRTQLILDIFARRAHTREGRLQVELAQLRYLLPRLAGSRAALSRLGGGIGTRGPGETKLETDRRRVRQRIHGLELGIERVRQHRQRVRRRRRKTTVPTVALVGYTNAGKTTLFNGLTGEAGGVRDAVFATLEPRVRRIRLPDRREAVVSDTVGFIDRLPHSLVAAFRATLEEVAEADLIVQVIDGLDPERVWHLEAVARVLAEVGALEVARLDVVNKADALDGNERASLAREHAGASVVSASTGEGIDALKARIARVLALDTRRVPFVFRLDREDDRRRMARLYRHADVVSHVAQDDRVVVEADVPRRLLTQWEATTRDDPQRDE